MDRGAWWTTVHGGCKESDTTEWLTLSLFTYVPRRADRSYSMSKKRWLCRHRRAERSHSTFKVRRGSGEEIPLVQGKEQWLPFAGAAMRDTPCPR